jgi:hypothetical protein
MRSGRESYFPLQRTIFPRSNLSVPVSQHVPAIDGKWPRRKVVRYLRIAWSVFWVVVCLPLIYLLVWSCQQHDMWVYFRANDVAVIGSQNGVIYFAPHANPGQLTGTTGEWDYWIGSAQPPASELQNLPTLPGGTMRVPYWSLIATACTFAALPWSRRFSLRTLLLVTTLVAVMLGLFMHSMKSSGESAPRGGLQSSGKAGLFGAPLPIGANLTERRVGDPVTGSGSAEQYSLSASAKDILAFFEIEMVAAGWERDFVQDTRSSRTFQKGGRELIVMTNVDAGMFILTRP